MSVTIASLITNLDTYIGDSSTDRISQAERFQALTEGVAWLLEELGNDHAIKTYALDYLDTIHYYKVTSTLGDLLMSADLRRDEEDQTLSALHKSARDIAEDIGQQSLDFAWSVERRDDDTYVVVTLNGNHQAKVVSDFDSTTAGGGTWEVDDTNSDATNLTADTVEKKQGSASLNFDVDVSQSANNRATITNSTLTTLDLSEYEDLASWLFWIYVPDVTEFSSVTLYWGSDSSNYWSATATTDIDGATFVAGWNQVKIDWADATKTSSPDEDEIDYIRIDFNYTASQGDDTDFRIDYLRIAKPERLTFHYVSWDVGENSGGTAISAFTATTDVPFFSSKYDQYRYPVAHKAASVIFQSLRLRDESREEMREAQSSLDRLRDIFPTSKIQETHNFKVRGVNFNLHRRRGRRAG